MYFQGLQNDNQIWWYIPHKQLHRILQYIEKGKNIIYQY